MDFSKLTNAEIKRLANAMQESGLTELEVQEGESRLCLRTGQEALVSHAPAMAPVQAIQPQQAPTPAAETAPTETLDAPMVGTYYHAANPQSDAFVKVGDTVKKGQTIGIIEAMKTMNHITAEKEGVISEMLVADGTPVQFGTALIQLS